MFRIGILASLTLVGLAALLLSTGVTHRPASASPGMIVYRDAAFGLPHIYADTDLELARENGREIAKDRLGQIVLISRVARGTLYQAFGLLDPARSTTTSRSRRAGYTSSELNSMFGKLPADVRALHPGVLQGRERHHRRDLRRHARRSRRRCSCSRSLGLGNDLFGNATNISDQVDPYYKAPGGADPEQPERRLPVHARAGVGDRRASGPQLRRRGFNEVSLLDQLNRLIAKFPTDGQEIWDDLNFLSDPLAPVVRARPGAARLRRPAGRTAGRRLGERCGRRPAARLSGRGRQLRLQQRRCRPSTRYSRQREELARRLGAWPALGSYAWMVDAARSATGNPWIGGFPQTGIQTPSIMHFVENRSAEGADHRIEAIGMEFVGRAARPHRPDRQRRVHHDHGRAEEQRSLPGAARPGEHRRAPLQRRGHACAADHALRADQADPGAATSIVVWRTHERGGNGGSRTVRGLPGRRRRDGGQRDGDDAHR